MSILPSALSVLVVCGLITHIATNLLVDFAPKLGLVQAPNARSSHKSPTPSGGGIGFASVGVLSGLAIAFLQPSLLPFVVACVAFGALGALDDKFELPAINRFAIQFLIVGSISFLSLTGVALPLMAIALLIVVTLIAGVWLINLVNFMDGVDGLVSLQAILMLAAMVTLRAAHFGTLQEIDLWAIGVVGALIGFFLLNKAPAKIFMGDAGSYFIGAFLFCYALVTILMVPHFAYAWLILISPMLADATVTLFRRVFAGDNPVKPHRKHAYQILSRRFGSHNIPTFSYAAVLAFVGFPVSVYIFARPEFAPIAVAIVYLAAIGALWKIGAGTDAEEPE